MKKEQKLRVGQRVCEKGFDLCIKGTVAFGFLGLGIALLRDFIKNKKK